MKMKILISVLLIVALFLIGLIIFLNNSNNPLSGKIISDEDARTYSPVDRYSSTNETHWDHLPLTYNLDSCNETFRGKMRNDILNALDFITNSTNGLITFREAIGNETADITYICDIGAIETKISRRIGTGEISYAEAWPYVYPKINTYAPSKVYIFSTYPCLGKRPTTVIHETLHLLGLEHKSPYIAEDVMQPYISENCNLKIVQQDIDYLNNIYNK